MRSTFRVFFPKNIRFWCGLAFFFSFSTPPKLEGQSPHLPVETWNLGSIRYRILLYFLPYPIYKSFFRPILSVLLYPMLDFFCPRPLISQNGLEAKNEGPRPLCRNVKNQMKTLQKIGDWCVWCSRFGPRATMHLAFYLNHIPRGSKLRMNKNGPKLTAFHLEIRKINPIASNPNE